MSTSLVTVAVTNGLPSRSPPIHEVNLIGEASSGSEMPKPSSNVLSSSRTYCGTASHKLFSITAKPHLASSTGVGRFLRISFVCQACVINCSRRTKS